MTALHSSHNHHDHSHIPQDKRILTFSFAIITGYMVVELLGGWYFNSLALLADAGHMINDSFSLFLALIALYLSPSKQIWIARLNGASLMFIALMILIEAIKRWNQPTEIMALPMLTVAVIGLLVNIVAAWIMLKGNHENLNIKAAYLHVLADMFGSMIASVAGLSAYFFGWQWVDVAASSVLSLFILRSGFGVIKQSFHA